MRKQEAGERGKDGGSRSSALCEDTPLQTRLRLILACIEPGPYHLETPCAFPLRTRPSLRGVRCAFLLPTIPPVLVGSGTVLEAASELYPFGVLRKRSRGTGPHPTGPYAAPRDFVLRSRAAEQAARPRLLALITAIATNVAGRAITTTTTSSSSSSSITRARG